MFLPWVLACKDLTLSLKVAPTSTLVDKQMCILLFSILRFRYSYIVTFLKVRKEYENIFGLFA